MKLKEMIDVYVSSGLSEKVWSKYHQEMEDGLISADVWNEFDETCRYWEISGKCDEIRDQNGKVLYRLDPDWDWKKV